MKRDGTAGQWLFELLGLRPELVSDGTREGYAYRFRQLLCTTAGVFDVSNIDRLICASPMERSPIPRDLMNGYESARTFAIRAVDSGFRLMSAALSRNPPEPYWDFRFYDTQDVSAMVVISADGHRMISATGNPG
jgi:hypothetical protein